MTAGHLRLRYLGRHTRCSSPTLLLITAIRTVGHSRSPRLWCGANTCPRWVTKAPSTAHLPAGNQLCKCNRGHEQTGESAIVWGHKNHLPSLWSGTQGAATPASAVAAAQRGLLFSPKWSEHSNVKSLCRTVWQFSTSAQLAPKQLIELAPVLGMLWTRPGFLCETLQRVPAEETWVSSSKTFPSSKTELGDAASGVNSGKSGNRILQLKVLS